MSAVYKRELRSYFVSPVGYVCVAVLVALYGMFFYQVMRLSSSSYVSAVYESMFSYSMMVIPIITMRSMTEDRKNKTDQALLTAPVSAASIVLGKFFACFSVFFAATTLGLLPAVTVGCFSSTPVWGMIAGNYLGTLLYGGAMVAIGVFISSLTVSQIIAAVGTFAISVALMYLDSLTTNLTNETARALVEWISFSSRFNPFTQGIFSVSSTVFFLSVAAVFLFLTTRRVESRRWN